MSLYQQAEGWHILEGGKRELLAFRCSKCRTFSLFLDGSLQGSTWCCNKRIEFSGDPKKLPRHVFTGPQRGDINRAEIPGEPIVFQSSGPEDF